MEQPADFLPDCYEVLAELGRGTTGVVYAARHKAFNRRLAIKVAAPWTAPARFMRECRVLAGLTSKPDCNIPALLIVTEHRGRLHYGRQLVDGETLEQRMGAGSISFRDGLGVIVAVARVVEWVHAQGVAHRNLSPANVLVGDDGAPWLIGFGRVGLLAGSKLLPVGAAGVPVAEDVSGLQLVLGWLIAAHGQAAPGGLERLTSPGTIATAQAFREAVSRCLQKAQPDAP